MSSTTRLSLAPSPGFCVKSTSLNAVAVPKPGADDAAQAVLQIPAHLKVFVNIAWDKHVPAPPERSEAAIERAIAGDVALGPSDPEDWYVPVIVSEPRSDKDKAGKPSAVFDCIFSASLKSRALRSPEFKTFLIELAFQRIEAQYGLQLSRQIGTPNIASKGKLAPRSALVPTALLSPHPPPTLPTPEPPSSSDTRAPRKPLIEEVSAADTNVSTPAAKPPPPPKGILKPATTVPSPAPAPASLVPALRWSKTNDGRLRIALSVPRLTRAAIPHTTLDLEPRRLILSVPSLSASEPAYALDLDLTALDSSILALFSTADTEESARQALTLKRERALDVDGARAEWRIADGQLVVYA